MRDRPRFHAEDLSPDRLLLSAEEAHHARNVLRLRAGEAVELFDGRGSVAAGRIDEVARAKVVVAVEGRWRIDDRAAPLIHLAFATPKGKRLDWLLEKATELGAASLRPVVFERSAARLLAGGGQASAALGGRLSAATRQRWLAHCVAAAKQSGLNWLPEIRQPLGLEEFLTGALTGPEGYVGLVGVVDGGTRAVREVLADAPPGRDLCLLVGPEGGMTKAEMTAAFEAGFVPARLGRTTLRVETAAIALLAAAVAICEAR